MARWKCPKCGSERLDVNINTWAALVQNGEDPLGDDNAFETDLDESDTRDHEWDGNSSMICRECDYRACADEFEISTDEDIEERCAGCGKKYDGCGDGYDGYCPECADNGKCVDCGEQCIAGGDGSVLCPKCDGPSDATQSPDYVKHEEGLV